MLGNRLTPLRFLFLSTAFLGSAPLAAQASDAARAQLVAMQPGQTLAAVSRWQQLTASDRMLFADYAGFALAYPTYPRMELIRTYAERALERDLVATPQQVVAFFERFPPQSNAARAR
ncbi:MAG: hypothetical protein ACEQR8_12050, partial [Cypionkella sp.]